jgi:peptidoglycan/xylan/chitin deacetylase (PgdA/CDA1 family)
VNEPPFCWPNGKRIAITIMVLLETWSEGKGPPYSVQTTSLKPGTIDNSSIAWGQYGGNEGIWRILRILDHFKAPGTFCPNARSAELYPDAIKQAARTGHEIAGHGYLQDQLMIYLERDEERATIRRSLDILEKLTGQRPKGWASPVLAWSKDTYELLAAEGLLWHGEAKDISLPQRIKTASGSLIALPVSDFADNRVLRASPRDYYDVYKDTFDYLYQREPMSMLPLALHAHWGGRPLMAAAFWKIMEYISQFPDVWFARSVDIAQWAIDQKVDSVPYARRFFQQ